MKKIILLVLAVVVMVIAMSTYNNYQEEKMINALEQMAEENGWGFTRIEN